MPDALDFADPSMLDLLGDERGEAAAEAYGWQAGNLTLRINEAATVESLRGLWRETTGWPDPERRVCRDFIQVRREMLGGES